MRSMCLRIDFLDIEKLKQQHMEFMCKYFPHLVKKEQEQ